MLHKVIIKNFKSLRNVELDLQKVNLLIGTNNSGKSNFLKALKYFSYKGDEKYLFGDVNFKINRDIEDFYPTQFIEIRKKGNSFLHIISKEAKWYFEVFDKKIKTFFHNKSKDELTMVTSSLSNNTVKEFVIYFNNLKIYKPDPNKLRSFQELDAMDTLEEDTSNLVSFLDNMRDSKPEVIDAIVEDLKICISNFVDIRFRKDPNSASKKQIGLIDVNKNIYWADELSEGVLYFLAILAILHQPNPPKILLLEEPERNVHPRRIKEIIDFIFRLSEEKDIQIIMTTHSMLVVDEFQDIPESVFIFDMIEGETKIQNLKTDIIDISNRKSKEKNFPLIDFSNSIGEKWFTGFLDGVPTP